MIRSGRPISDLREVVFPHAGACGEGRRLFISWMPFGIEQFAQNSRSLGCQALIRSSGGTTQCPLNLPADCR